MRFRSIPLNLALLTTHQPIDVDAEPKGALEAKNSDTLSILVGSEEQILSDLASIEPSKRLALAVNQDGKALAVIANTDAFAFEVPVSQVQQIVDLNSGDFTFFHQISVVGEKANMALIDGDDKAPYVMSFARKVREVLTQQGETSAMFIGSTNKRTAQAWLNGSEENVEIVAPFDGDLRHKIGTDAIVIALCNSNKYAVLPQNQLVTYLETDAATRDIIGYSMGQLEGVQIEDMSLDIGNGQFVVTDTNKGYQLASLLIEEDGLTGKIVVQSTIEADDAAAIVRATSDTVITLDRKDAGKFSVRPATSFSQELQGAIAA